jgi:Putative adhesin
MISRTTLIGALVVVELAILGAAGRAISGGAAGWNFPHESPPPPTTSLLDKKFETGAAPHVVVDVDKADVNVQAGAATSVHVLGTMRVSGFISGVRPQLTAVRTADGVRVAAESGLVRIRRGSLERSVRITVPPGADVEIVSAGDLVTSGLRGKLLARLWSGAVRVANHRGDVDVTTTSGDVDLLDVQSALLMLRTDDGDLKLTASGADHIDVRSSSGTITAVDLRAVDGALQTDHGHIDVGFSTQSDAAVNLHTSDGRITGVGPATAGEDGPDNRAVRLGSARGHFTVSTGSGPIAVTQGVSV